MPHTIERREFLAAVTFGGLASTRAAVAQTPPQFMYVGSFTGGGRGKGEGISVFQRKQPSDPWTLVQVMSDHADPSFLKIDGQGRFLYSAHGAGTQATCFRIDPSSGRLQTVNQQATKGVNGVHLDIDATGRFLVVANYATGTLVLLPVNQDGSLGEVSDLATLEGEPGPHKTEQTSSHPHHCPFDPTGRFVVVPDKGFDRVYVYRVDTERGKLVASAPPSVASRRGAAPRHVDFHPSAPYMYVINELDSTLTTYAFDPAKEVLEPRQVITTLPPSYTGNNSTAEVWVARSGRFLYGSNRGHDSIAIFAIDAATGTLTSVGWESTQGRTPRYFGLDPTDTHLYAANQNSDTVVIFEVDQQSGKLTPTKEILKVASPSTIVFR